MARSHSSLDTLKLIIITRAQPSHGRENKYKYLICNPLFCIKIDIAENHVIKRILREITFRLWLTRLI